MRDDILDRLVQPAVNRIGLPVERTATGLAHAYGALTIASAAWSFDIEQSSMIGAALQVGFAMYLMRGLLIGASMGSSVLGSPLGTIHMLFRVLFLGLGVMAIGQDVLALAFGLASFDGRTVPALAMDAAMLSISLSMYVAVCDQPPPKRRRGSQLVGA